MPRIPVVSGHDVIRARERIGYRSVRRRGSHVRLRCEAEPSRQPTTVPLHREIRRGTLLSILADAGLSLDGFTSLLK